jgi:hypothetical protein
MAETHTPRQLAVLRTYQDAIQTLRARRDQLDVPHEIIDDIAGLPGGYTSKVLTPKKPMKHIGPVSWNVFEALGMSLVAIENGAALARSRRSHKWRQRRQDQMLAVEPYPQAPGRITTENASAMARKRAAALSAARRRQIARKAAQARWSKPHVVEVKADARA